MLLLYSHHIGSKYYHWLIFSNVVVFTLLVKHSSHMNYYQMSRSPNFYQIKLHKRGFFFNPINMLIIQIIWTINIRVISFQWWYWTSTSVVFFTLQNFMKRRNEEYMKKIKKKINKYYFLMVYLLQYVQQYLSAQ